jgi:hypothetical protein
MTSRPIQPEHDDRGFPPLSRREELLADRAAQGLSPAEAVELEAIGGSENESLDRAAAALDRGLSRGTGAEVMPAEVRARLLAMGDQWSRNVGRERGPALRLAQPASTPASVALPTGTVRFGDRVFRLGTGLGGWIAAAACLGFAAIVVTRNPGQRVIEIPIVREIGEAFNSPVQGFDEFKERGDIVALATVGDDGTEAELVFDPAADRGFLAVAGLDPSEHSDRQYQLWVFDAGRADPHPVNGGLFDVQPVQAGAKIVIPVSTRLPVRNPVAFAVTVEPRGGSVVSEPQRIRIPPRLDMGPPEPTDGWNGTMAEDFSGHAAP